MEKALRSKLSTKLEYLSRMAMETACATVERADSTTSTQPDLSFINQAMDELLRARNVLSSSYAYGYFLIDCGYNRTIFEYLQVHTSRIWAGHTMLCYRMNSKWPLSNCRRSSAARICEAVVHALMQVHSWLRVDDIASWCASIADSCHPRHRRHCGVVNIVVSCRPYSHWTEKMYVVYFLFTLINHRTNGRRCRNYRPALLASSTRSASHG